MAGRKPPSEAMVGLCAAANRAGRRRFDHRWVDIRPRQVEAWLQDDLLLDPERPGLGRGRGRAVYYTLEHVDRAVEVAELVRSWRSLDAVAVVLFLRRRTVPVARLRRAYLALVDRLGAEIAKAAGRGLEATEEEIQPGITQWSPQEVAEWAEPVLADRLSRNEATHTLRSRLAEQPDPGTSLSSLVFALGAATLGAGFEEELARELAAALGIRRDLGPVLDRPLDHPTAERVGPVVETATVIDFETARDIVEKLPKAYGEMVTRNAEFSFLGPAIETAETLGSERSRALLILLPLLFRESTGMRLDAMDQLLDSLCQGQLALE